MVLAATLRIGEASRAAASAGDQLKQYGASGEFAQAYVIAHEIGQGDVPAALQAAAAVGDDRMQKMARGYVTPDSFTHGSSQQRVGWFNRGLNSGRVSACNTFSAAGQAP